MPSKTRWRQRRFRALILGLTCLALLANARQIPAAPPGLSLLLGALILLSRGVPVAISREKPVTFTAAFVFATALLTNGVVAGGSALVACLLPLGRFQHGGRFYAGFVGAQYALSALAAHRTFVHLNGEPRVPPQPGLIDFGIVCASALAFVGVNGLIAGLGNLGTRYARPPYVESAILTQALAYLFSFPFAMLLVFGYHAFGLAALPCLAALLLICGHAVRMTVENRMLAQQMWAVEALGRASTSGVRAALPLQRFLTLARELIAFDRAILWLLDETGTNLSAQAVYPKDDPLPDPAEAGPETPIASVFRNRAPRLLADARRRHPHPSPDSPPASWILYPILLDDQAIGVAQFVRSAHRPFTHPELRRLAALAPQAAIAFESVRLRYLMNRYENLATIDGLTGLLNHRHLQERLRKELERAARYHHTLSVLMLDVDGFKQFNDTFGHPQGDVLLQSIAEILRQNVRGADIVGRYGGEEFLIVLPETARDDAYVLAERIRAAVEAAWFPTGDGYAVNKTVSIGVASYPDDATTPDQLVQHADAALYRAKRSGKNRVLTA